MTFQLPAYSGKAERLADSVADQFEEHFRNHLEQRLAAFFGGGCAEAFAEIAAKEMTPALQQLAALPASPAVNPTDRSRPISPTRGLGFARKSLGTASIDVEVSSDDSSDA